MIHKRGISTVVASLLIILLVIVAIGVIWVVVRNVVTEGAGGISFSQFTIDLDIRSAVLDGNDLTVSVRRNPGEGKVTGLVFVIAEGTTYSESVEEEVSLDELEERVFAYNLVELGVENADRISVSPVYETEQGKEIVGEILDTEIFRGSEGGVSGEPGTGICGDDVIQSPNSEEVNEICDGISLGGETCLTQGFDGGGNLDCDENCLSYDTSDCSMAVPSSCDGVWNEGEEDEEVECETGGTGCSASCLCETGYQPTTPESENCELVPSFLSGIVELVWPPGAEKYFDSQNLPKSSVISTYIGKYVSFNGVGCVRISYAEYLDDPDYNKSYVRLETVTSISSGNTFEVWDYSNCGA
jgi:hypothetical protein